MICRISLPPPHLHLDNGTQNMISSLTLKQSIVIVDFTILR